jgi:hypothetical protein
VADAYVSAIDTSLNSRLGRLPENHGANTSQRQYDRQDVGLAEPVRQQPSMPATPQTLPMTPVQMAFDAHQGFRSSISFLHKKARRKRGRLQVREGDGRSGLVGG